MPVFDYNAPCIGFWGCCNIPIQKSARKMPVHRSLIFFNVHKERFKNNKPL